MKKVFLLAAFVLLGLAGLSSCSIKEKCPAYGHVDTAPATENLG
jgi:hypothetical protein